MLVSNAKWLLPCIQTLLVRKASQGNVGGLLGFNQTFSYLGNVVGPLLGGVVFACFGYPTFFLGIGALALLCAVGVMISMRRAA